MSKPTQDVAAVKRGDVGTGVVTKDDLRNDVVARLDQARTWLLEAKTMQDINKVRIGAEAIRIYTVQAKLGREAEQGACALRLVAERRIGELIRTEQAAGRLATTSNGRPSKAFPTERLTDIGISHKESHQFQKLADIADEDFNECIEELKDDNALSRAALLRMTQEVIEEVNEEQRQALKGREAIKKLNALAPEGFDPSLDRDQMNVMATLTDAIHALEGMDDPAVMAAQVKSVQLRHFKNLVVVTEWLGQFTKEMGRLYGIV